MQPTDSSASARFYFSLPRLIAQLAGGDATKSESNWTEINFIGGLIHIVVYGFAFHLLLGRAPLALQLLLAIPLIAVVWLGWIALLALNYYLIRLLRKAGLLRDLSDDRAQRMLVGIVTTAFAMHLLRDASSWPRLVAMLWIGAIALNLLAAVLLPTLRANAASE